MYAKSFTQVQVLVADFITCKYFIWWKRRRRVTYNRAQGGSQVHRHATGDFISRTANSGVVVIAFLISAGEANRAQREGREVFFFFPLQSLATLFNQI